MVMEGIRPVILRFSSLFPTNKISEIPNHVFLGDNEPIEAAGVWRIMITVAKGAQGVVQNVLHVPKTTKFLLSVSAMTDTELHVEFERQECWVSRGDQTLLTVQSKTQHNQTSCICCLEHANHKSRQQVAPKIHPHLRAG